MDPDQTAPTGAVCSGSTLFASILNSSVILGNYLQQTISADDIFRCSFSFFVAFPWVTSNQYWAGRVYDMSVYYMTGTPEGSTESGFMEKPEIEPATPGLQGIALIHYTTGLQMQCFLAP